ncbi:hypothetical protein BGX31_003958, partial [Mortierella sp. GBA43]
MKEWKGSKKQQEAESASHVSRGHRVFEKFEVQRDITKSDILAPHLPRSTPLSNTI